MTKISNAKIDKAGAALSKNIYKDEYEFIELEYLFDDYRKSHLQPLTETTLELQHWLTGFGSSYYIAQRLKRKPQIVRKLNRLHVRLTQLQDIGGCRIIVDNNKDVDRLHQYIIEKAKGQHVIELFRTTDYREKGRDDTGYRALHLILNCAGKKLELQIRSKIQHYWAESIERTSVIYGYYLKEKEGDESVIQYFKKLSDVFFEMEAGREPSSVQKLEIDRLRHTAEEIIRLSDRNKVFDSYVNEDIIKTLTSIETSKNGQFNNWIIVFDWNTGSFVSWDIVNRDPDEAIKAYVEHEKQFNTFDGYEVVMIGSSDVATVRQTHSHYFGIDGYENILENLEESVLGFSKRMNIDTGARQLLLCLYRRNFWGSRSIATKTLKNHFCKNVITFDSSLGVLAEKELVLLSTEKGTVSLNIKNKGLIEQYL